MIDYETVTTNHRICMRTIKYSRTLGVYEFSCNQDGLVKDKGKSVDGFSLYFYKLENNHKLLIKAFIGQLVRDKKVSEDRIKAANGLK